MFGIHVNYKLIKVHVIILIVIWISDILGDPNNRLLIYHSYKLLYLRMIFVTLTKFVDHTSVLSTCIRRAVVYSHADMNTLHFIFSTGSVDIL